MEKHKYIKNTRFSIPWVPGLTAHMAMNHWNAPDWLYGAWYTLFIPTAAICIFMTFYQEPVDLLGILNKKSTDTPEEVKTKSRFMEKLEEAMKNNPPRREN